MLCWNCGKTLPEPPYGKITFRAVCDHCEAALHCCKNCKYYRVGLPNDCEVPGTDYITDRSASNLCEEFSLLGKVLPKESGGAKNKFNDLFK